MTLVMTMLLTALPIAGMVTVHLANRMPEPEEVYDMR